MLLAMCISGASTRGGAGGALAKNSFLQIVRVLLSSSSSSSQLGQAEPLPSSARTERPSPSSSSEAAAKSPPPESAAAAATPNRLVALQPHTPNSNTLQSLCNTIHSIGRSSNSALRHKEALRLAAYCHQTATDECLRALVEYVKDDREIAKAFPNRVLYYCINLALNRNELDTAKELIEMIPLGVHILGTSLRVKLLARLGRLREALEQLELVLNEDVPRFDVRRKITDEALDELCAAIKAKSNSILEMRRFRILQRLLTTYERRSTCTITELLASPVFDVASDEEQEPQATSSETKLDDKTMEKIIRIAPHVLSEV